MAVFKPEKLKSNPGYFGFVKTKALDLVEHICLPKGSPG
jgi:hypothetical protein